MVDEVHPEQKGYSKLNALMDKINLNQSCLCSHSYVDMMTQDEKYQGGAIIEREIVQSKASDEKIKTVKKESLASVEK